MKIGQYLQKLWPKIKMCVFFIGAPCSSSSDVDEDVAGTGCRQPTNHSVVWGVGHAPTQIRVSQGTWRTLIQTASHACTV